MVSSERMVARTVLLDEHQHERLRALSEATRVPAATYVREGIDAVLDIAERQQRMVDSAQERDRDRQRQTEKS